MVKSTTILIFTLLFMPLSHAGNPPVFATADGAMRGYDPVAYFEFGKPTRGKAEFSAEWQGASYRFANADHLQKFLAEPQKYAPQYGGYCAYAVSQGYTASTVPEAWRIVDGKLYLNYSSSVQAIWNRDIPAYIDAADRNWPGVLD